MLEEKECSWYAIEDALDLLYPDQGCFVLGARPDDAAAMVARFGANADELAEFLESDDADEVHPLTSVRVYLCHDCTAHWHFVTLGLSDLYADEPNDSGFSGYGFELTMRVPVHASEETPPYWPIRILQHLADYVFQSGRYFEPGHHVDTDGVITSAFDNVSLTALAFINDPRLPEVQTASGKVSMLQIVGLTEQEYAWLHKWNTRGILGALQDSNPLLFTDLFRDCALQNSQILQRIQDGARHDGSSTGAFYVEHLKAVFNGERVKLEIGCQAVDHIFTALIGRIPFGRDLRLVSSNYSVTFRPAQSNGWSREHDNLLLDLTVELAQAMQESLQPMAGIYGWDELPGLKLKVT